MPDTYNDDDFVQSLAKQYGLKPEQSDIDARAAKNPEDRAKFDADLTAQAQRRVAPTSDRQYDSQSSAYNQATNQPTGQAPQSPRDTALSQVQSAYTSGGGGNDFGSFMDYLKTKQQQDSQRDGVIWGLLQNQLDGLQQPISAETPGIKESLAGNRIGLQRGGEQQRRDAAEWRAYEGYGPESDAFKQDTERINQQTGEAGAQYQGNVMLQASQQRQQQLQQLLQTAMATGNASAAQQIQAQLQALQMQQQGGQFNDQLGYQYNALNQNGNLAALNAILGAA